MDYGKTQQASLHSLQMYINSVHTHLPTAWTSSLCHHTLASTPYKKHFYLEYVDCHCVVTGAVETNTATTNQGKKNPLCTGTNFARTYLPQCFGIPLIILSSIIQGSKPPFNAAPSTGICRSAPTSFAQYTNKQFSYPSSQAFLKLLLLWPSWRNKR